MSYQIGLDGYNILLVMMTAFLGPLVVAGAFTAIAKDVKLFYAMVFLVQFAMIGTFLAQDLFLFYVFWETMLIPMFLLIGIWGGERRIYATIKFVLYTAFGSILMLAAVIYLVWSLQKTTGITSFAFADLMQTHLPVDVQSILLAAFALSFAIKVPMAPLHTWLPDAHVEAPTAGSVILAGVMLKMGTYGFMKLGFPLFPDATQLFTPVLMSLAVLSIVYGACLALVQDDIKKIIAYSSISHLGYVMLGLLSLDLIGIQGAVIQMVSHGLVAGGLFLMVGMIYERCHTRELNAYGGLAKLLPVYSVFFMILTLASVGLPTTSGFTGEFLVLLGAFKAAWPLHVAGNDLPLALAAVAVAGVVLGALYMLRFALGFLYGVGAGAAPAPRRPRPAREGDPRPDRRRGVRARPLPRRADAEDRAGGQGYRALVATPAPRRHGTMNTTLVLTAMLPEHLLLLGIVVVIVLEIVGRARRAALAVALVCVAAAAAAAANLALAGYAAAPFAGQFSVDADDAARQGDGARVRAAGAADRARRVRRRRVPGAAAVVAVRRLPAAVRRQLRDPLPRPRADVAAGLRARPARLAASAERRSGAQVPRPRRHRDGDVPDGCFVPLRRGGSLAIDAFPRALAAGDGLARAAVVLVVLAFFLKAAIVPFHAWAPDAYEAASVPVTAYMATIVKAGVLLAAVRLFGNAQLASPMLEIVAALPLLSIVWGNLAAMRQPSLRRMIAYSSIAHAGYLFYALLGDSGRSPPVGGVLPARLRSDEPARVRGAAGRGRRRRARPPRQPARPVPPRAVRGADARHRDALARRHSALPRLRRQVPDLPQRHERRPHDVRRARPRRQLSRHLLLPARDPAHVHEPGRGRRRRARPASARLRRDRRLPAAAMLVAVFPGWVIGRL